MVLRLRFLREGFVVYISYRRRRRSRDFSLVLLPDAERPRPRRRIVINRLFGTICCLRFAAQRERESDQIAPYVTLCGALCNLRSNFNGLNPAAPASPRVSLLRCCVSVLLLGSGLAWPVLDCVTPPLSSISNEECTVSSSFRAEISSKCSTDRKSIYTFTRVHLFSLHLFFSFFRHVREGLLSSSALHLFLVCAYNP